MASSVVIPQATLPAGTRVFGPFPVPQGLSIAMLSFDRTSWTDPTLNVDVLIDLSLDGGARWASTSPDQATDPFPIACRLVGGALLDKNGVALTSGLLGSRVPQPGNPNRLVRATVTNNLPMTTSANLVTE